MFRNIFSIIYPKIFFFLLSIHLDIELKPTDVTEIAKFRQLQMHLFINEMSELLAHVFVNLTLKK